jgi:hypothetical protein
MAIAPVSGRGFTDVMTWILRRKDFSAAEGQAGPVVGIDWLPGNWISAGLRSRY